MKRIHRLTVLSLFTLSLGAQGQTPAPTTEPANEPAKEVPQASAMDADLFYELLLAELSLANGDYEAGFTLLLNDAVKTNDPRLYKRALDVATQARAGDASLQAARAWKAANPASAEANRRLLHILLELNRPSDTLGPLRDELNHVGAGFRAQALTQIPRLYARVSDKAAAAKVVEQALGGDLTQATTANTAWAVVGQMRLAAGNTAGAQAAARKIVGAPELPDAAALLALDLLEKQLEPGDALLRQYLKTAQSPEIRMAYARLLLQTQHYAEAEEQLSTLTTQKPEYEPGWLVLGTLQLQNQQYDRAQKSLDHYLALLDFQPKEPGEQQRGAVQAYMFLADIAVHNKDLDGAQKWLARIDQPYLVQGVLTRRAGILAQQGKVDEALALLRGMPDADPADARTKLLGQVQVLRDAKRYQQAYDLLAKAPAAAKPDADLLYEQAMLAEKLEQLGDMERLLRAIMEAQPDYAAAYNALGYSLAERSLRLDEARQLIQTALKYSPGDPYISDSLGWVEYRLGHKAEAARILEAAFQKRPDAEIGAHLGEVLWALGQRDRALDFWKQARKLGPDNENLSDTLKRLGVNL